MQIKPVLAVAVALAAAASFLPTGAASAAAPPGKPQPLPIESVPVRAAPVAGEFLVTGTDRSPAALDEAEMQDLATYAKDTGRDLSALVAAHQGIDEFNTISHRLEKTRPDLFVRAGLATDGAAGYWIQLTAKPSAEIIADLERLPVDTEVQYGAPASAKELEELAYRLTSSLAAHADAIREAATRYDHERRVLRLQYAPVEGAALTTLGSVFQDAVTAGTIEGELPLEVVPERVDRVSVTEVTVQGGRDLDLARDSRAECTSGFTARRGSNRGVLTARHCANALLYGNRAGVIGTNPAIASEAPGGLIDLQFHRTQTQNGHSTNKQFRATGRQDSDDRAVTAVKNATIGSVVCHWGRTSGYSCDSVAYTNECLYISGNRCGIDVTNRDISSPGDSGGPWFFGTTAHGIHTGASNGSASYFTRIGRVESHLNATVLQN